MNNFLSLFFALILGFGSYGSSFDNSKYIDDHEVIEVLNEHFVKDCSSAELSETLEIFLSNHIDKVSHITAHHSKKDNLYFYAVYGSKDGTNTFTMVEVDQENFSKGKFYEFENILKRGSCSKSFFNGCTIKTCIKNNTCRQRVYCVFWACNDE